MIGLSQPSNFILSKARFQRSYNWDVLLPDMGFSLGGLIGLGVGQFVQGVDFGDYKFNSSQIRVGPYNTSFVGSIEAPKISITFLKPSPDVVSLYFNQWKKLMIDEKGLYKPKSSYQKNIYVRFIDSTSLALNKYKLIGAFPLNFPSYDLNYTDSRVTTYKIEFSVDRIETEIF